MTVKKIILIFMAAAMLCPIAACANPESAASQNSPAPQPSQAPSASLPVSEAEPRCFITADHYEETFLADDGITELMYVSYDMPVVTIDGDEAGSGKINSVLVDLKERFLHAESEESISVDTALADAKSAREQGYDGPAYAMEQTFSLQRIDRNVICVLNQAYTDLGGPHPNSYTSSVCFDRSGNPVSLASLSDDPEGFRQFCAERVLALAERDEGDGRYYENYRELFPNNICDGRWYFSSEGLVFVYNTYDIGTHAAGGFEFTIPYGELNGVMDSRWLPEASDANGSVACDYAGNSGSIQPLFSLEMDASGSEFVFSAQGVVRNVQVSAATYDGEQYLDGGMLAFVSRMDEGECFSVRYLFPGDLSCLSLSYDTAGGEQITKHILISGEDGSVLMAE